MTGFLYNNLRFPAKNTSFCPKKPRFAARTARTLSFSPLKPFRPVAALRYACAQYGCGRDNCNNSGQYACGQDNTASFAAEPVAPFFDGYELTLFKKLSALVAGRQAVIACVGTDLVGGDCLGPLVGQMLIEAGAPVFVYGTLEMPITALNVEETGEFIRITHPDRIVIAVDCAVGVGGEEGLITVSGGPLRPGLALGKQLGALGDISVTAVTSSHSPEKKEFSAVRLGFVYSLARRVAELILSCFNEHII